MLWIAFAKSVSAVVNGGNYGRRGQKMVAAGYHARTREMSRPPHQGRKSDCRIGIFA
jgi:hypothetical protein